MDNIQFQPSKPLFSLSQSTVLHQCIGSHQDRSMGVTIANLFLTGAGIRAIILIPVALVNQAMQAVKSENATPSIQQTKNDRFNELALVIETCILFINPV
uniref:Uncharacterized protein n=1 Tax=Pyxicephalus adspersus TaxID=30357 RepID=A0AAV3A9Z5_PYXAD|nr:TPA: hypothetical protein GDO54_014545 [Pyxicephalus adspersus]